MEIRDIITLDDNNNYIIASKIKYNDKNYYYLVDVNKSDNLMFCYEDKGDLVEINDKKLTTKLLPLFCAEAKNILNDLFPNE